MDNTTFPGALPCNMTQEEAATRGVKLRESCDSCLMAKVKCGKGRPVCARCLQNGNECKYSPSARAGRKHRNNAINKPPPRRRPASIEIPSNGPYFLGPSAGPHTAPFMPQDFSNLDRFDDTSTPVPGSAKNLCSNTPPLTHDDQQREAMKIENTELPAHTDGSNDSGLQILTPPLSSNTACDPPSASPIASFPDLSSTSPSPTTGLNSMMDTDGWMTGTYNTYQVPEPYNLDIGIFGDPMLVPPPAEPSLFDPAIFDSLQQSIGRADAQEPLQATIQTCKEGQQGCEDCFAECLRALHTLHSHSWKTPAAEQGIVPFDVILTINREAVKGCHAMMNCTTCSTKNGRPVSTMLLGTVFGKVMSLYRAAVTNRMQPQKDARLAFGAYIVLDDDRHLLETEILLFELKKVQRIISQFQSSCRDVAADQNIRGVYEPQALYLATQLGYIIDFLHAEKEQR